MRVLEVIRSQAGARKKALSYSVTMLVVLTPLFAASSITAFTLTMMARPKRGNLKKVLYSSTTNAPKSIKSVNQGRGQKILGVNLPEVGKIKGWEFGNTKLACANVDGNYYAVQGECPRCAFDLYRGKVVVDKDAFSPGPHVACRTCSTTFSLKTGKHGPPFKQNGLAGFVGNLAKTATIGNASKDAKTYVITLDGEGNIYCREG